MIGIVAFLTSTVGRVLVIGGGIIALWVAFASHYQAKGRAKAEAETEKQNAQVIQRSDRVRSKSADPRVRGSVDPNYID